MLTANKSLKIAGFVSTSNPYTTTVEDFAVEASTNAGNLTITLHDPASAPGQTLFIKKISSDSNLLIVSNTIEGNSAISVSEQFASFLLRSNGTNWMRMDQGQPTGLNTFVPVWQQFTVDYTQLAAAALTNDIELFSLVADRVIHAVVLQPTTAFSGGTITDYKISIGLAGDLTKYLSQVDVDTAPSSTNFFSSDILALELVSGGPTSVRIAATSVGDTLDNAAAGDVRVGVLVSRWN